MVTPTCPKVHEMISMLEVEWMRDVLIYSLSNELRAISSLEMGLYPKKQLTSLIKDLVYLEDGIPKDEAD